MKKILLTLFIIPVSIFAGDVYYDINMHTNDILYAGEISSITGRFTYLIADTTISGTVSVAYVDDQDNAVRAYSDTNDWNLHASISNEFLLKSGGIMTGGIDMDGNEIEDALILNGGMASDFNAHNFTIFNVAAPTNNQDAANKEYVDSKDTGGTNALTESRYVKKAGDIMEGTLFMGLTTTWHKIYVGQTTTIGNVNGWGGFEFYDTVGGSMKYYTNALWFSNPTAIRNLANPGTDTSAANKLYVDTADNLKLNKNDGRAGILGVTNLSIYGGAEFNNKDISGVKLLKMRDQTTGSDGLLKLDNGDYVFYDAAASQPKLSNIASPVNNADVANKIYVDNATNGCVNKSGDTVGTLTVSNLITIGSINNYSSGNFKAGVSAGAGASGIANSYLGVSAGYNATGSNNIYLGQLAGNYSSGDFNCYLGFNNGHLSYGSFNYYLGQSVAYEASGNYNSYLGGSAGYNAVGDGNIYLGKMAGRNSIGTNCLYFGQDAGQYKTNNNVAYFGYITEIDCNTARVSNVSSGILPDDAVNLSQLQGATNAIPTQNDNDVRYVNADGDTITGDLGLSNNYLRLNTTVLDGCAIKNDNGGLYVSDSTSLSTLIYNTNSLSFSAQTILSNIKDPVNTYDGANKHYVDVCTNKIVSDYSDTTSDAFAALTNALKQAGVF